MTQIKHTQIIRRMARNFSREFLGLFLKVFSPPPQKSSSPKFMPKIVGIPPAHRLLNNKNCHTDFLLIQGSQQICTVTHQKDQPYRNKHTQMCTLSLGMIATRPTQTGAVQIRVGLELAEMPSSLCSMVYRHPLRELGSKMFFRIIFPPPTPKSADFTF